MRNIGLSLSFCIKDMILGNDPLGQTLCIISGTNFQPTDELTWQEVAYDHYSKTIWKNLDKEDCMYYLNNYPIVQPRSFGFDPPSIAGGHWITVGPETNGLTKETIKFFNPYSKDGI
jgi:hypothetical protein